MILFKIFQITVEYGNFLKTKPNDMLNGYKGKKGWKGGTT